MRELAVKGLKWSFVQQFSATLLNYVSVIVLAALIEPRYHGFITIASIPIGFVGILGSIGVREKIIKEKEISENYKSCLFGFVLVSSIVLFILSILLTFFISWFYQENYSYWILIKYGCLISLITPIGVLNHYYESFQTRDVNFKGLSLIYTLALLIGIIISISVAYYGYGYLALSLKMVLPHLFNLIIYLIYYKPTFNVAWCPDMYKEFKSFSTFLTLNNIANYFVRNIDYIIIGKFFNPEILGQYSIAYKILLFPMRNVTSRIQSVAMPMLAKLNSGSEDFNKKYFMIIGLVSFITLPMMALVTLTAPDWVPLTFSQKYNLLVQMIMVLSVVGAFQSIVSPVGVLYILRESTKLMFVNSIVISIVISSTFLLSSLTHDINIVLITYAITWLTIVMPLSMFRIYKVYNMKLSKFFSTMFPSFFSVIVAFVTVYFCRIYLFSFNPMINMIISILLFLAFFLLSYRIIMKKEENSFHYYYQIFRGR